MEQRLCTQCRQPLDEKGNCLNWDCWINVIKRMYAACKDDHEVYLLDRWLDDDCS